MSRTRRLATAFAMVAAGTLTVSSFAAPAEAAKAKPKVYKEYVSLGDSWTADVVLLNAQGLPATEFAPIDCAQSRVNYPRLVAKALNVKTFRDASCGSATTRDFTQPQTGLPIGGTNPPQFDRLTKTTDLVTVGIGGNDAGVASAATGCLNLLPNLGLGLPSPLGGSCKDKLTAGGKDQLTAQINAAEPKVVAALKAIRKKSPKARILAVNYLAAVPTTGCYPYVQADNADIAYLYVKFNELNAMVKRAAAKGGAELVDTYTPTIGHDVCQLPHIRYVEGVIPLSLNAPAVSIPLHPNSAGAAAQAEAVLAQIKR
ncbi:SGNH/GDSL hydrolase family protein [Aeromicrobium sp.]|uniref:SGNH/GDSL hydrolase family protein n=1 Tax=Aeromicrobium sp. TaxID=1871063 RepID=UPI002FCC54AD